MKDLKIENKMKILIIIILLIFNSCSNTKPNYSNMTDTELFSTSLKEIKKENYLEATEILKQIEYNAPYSTLITDSWYIQGYAFYKAKKYTEAIEIFEKAIKLQPTNKNTPYAMYMVAMCYYDQISPTTRDQKIAILALNKMKQLKIISPNSKYTDDIKPKILIALNNIAGQEMFIAKTLMNKKNIAGAINRYQTIIKKYDTSIFTPEALFRLAEIYKIIEEKNDIKNIIQILKLNYPNSKWYKLAKKLI